MARSHIPAVQLRRRVMRTSRVLVSVGVIGLTFGAIFALESALGFDGTPTVDPPRGGPALQSLDPGRRVVVPPASVSRPPAAVPAGIPAGGAKRAPREGIPAGTQAFRAGRGGQALRGFVYEARRGGPGGVLELGPG